MTDTYIPDDQRDLTPLMTRRGRELLLGAAADGRSCRISHVAVGSADPEGDNGGYEVHADQAQLHYERQRVACKVQVEAIDDHTRAHVTAIVGRGDEQPREYEIREIGFFLTDDPGQEGDGQQVLFAIWASEPGGEALMVKSPDVDLLLSFELVLPDVAAESIQISETHLFDFPDATREIGGVIRLASEADVTAARSDALAVTPATLPYATSLATTGGDVRAFYLDSSGTAHVGAIGDQSTHGLVVSRTPEPHPAGSGGTPGAYVPSRTLHLKGGGPHQSGARLNFGDADYVYIDEPVDDALRLHGTQVVLTAGDCAIDTELEKPGATRSSGIHLQSDSQVELKGSPITLNGPVRVNGTLDVSETITSPKFRQMESFEDGRAEPGYTNHWTWTRTVRAPGDFLLLASFEDVETAPWHTGTIQLRWDDEVVAEIRASTYFHDAGDSHPLITSPSTHSLRLAQAAGSHTATVSYWCDGGWMTIAKCQLSLIEL